MDIGSSRMAMIDVIIFISGFVVLGIFNTIYRNKQMNKINRQYVDVVDDTFRAISSQITEAMKDVKIYLGQMNERIIIADEKVGRVWTLVLQRGNEHTIITSYCRSFGEIYELAAKRGFGPDWKILTWNAAPVDFRTVSTPQEFNDLIKGNVNPKIPIEDLHTQAVLDTPVLPVQEDPNKNKGMNEYMSYLEYAKDHFAETPVEKGTLTKIINKIKKQNGN